MGADPGVELVKRSEVVEELEAILERPPLGRITLVLRAKGVCA